MSKYVIGIDYGTDSVRALIVDSSNGKELSSAVSYYPRWKKGLYCDSAKNRYRQHPKDYIESLESVVVKALSAVDKSVKDNIVGLSFDTTGSTPVAVDSKGTPLALLPEFEENPNAMFVLWKDHTAVQQAKEINDLAAKSRENYTKYEGGIYSSEWVWSKMLHIIKEDNAVAKSTASWSEHCDWITGLMVGNTDPKKMLRSRCTAGHKAMWNEEWGGLPPKEFLTQLDHRLADLVLFTETHTGETLAGMVTDEWLKKFGLSGDIAVSVGAIDAHVGAVGAGIKPNVLTRIMGTSTCDILMVEPNKLEGKLVAGICGQVDGSVVPGYIGLEAGQSAFGDVYAWFKSILAWPLQQIASQNGITEEQIEKITDSIIPTISEKAAAIDIDHSGPIALDWFNGRRTPDANQMLKGAIRDLSLGTDAPMIFKALVESTAFGSKAIVDRFLREGVEIDSIIAIGGISQKSPFVMQTLADVLNMPIKVNRSEQTCALGAAMFAAVAAGVYPTTDKAQDAMGAGFSKEYIPNNENHMKYMKLYEQYLKLGKFIDNE